MKQIIHRVALCSVLLGATLGASCERNDSGAVRGAPASEPPPPAEVLAWVLPYDNSLASLERNARFVTIASPTFFRLAVQGKTAKLEDWDPGAPFPRSRLTTALSGAAAAVLPLVGCIGPCGPKISRVLDDEAARRAHVHDLLRVVHAQGLGGLVIDYEDVDASERSVTSFVDELARGLHAAGKRLVLVIQEPCGVDPGCRRSPYPFALKTLVQMVDHLAIMEYDFAVDGSAPPAPRAWVDRGLRKVAAEVGGGPNLRKVICALPFYGRVTKGIADDTAVLFDEVKAGSVRNAKVSVGPLRLDPHAFSKVATVTGPGKSGVLYLEDRETIAARIAHVSSLNLGGIAIWRLGGEDPCITPELAKLRRMPGPACP